MINPNSTVHYPTPPPSLNENWRKYIIQAATANDIKLNFSLQQKAILPRGDLKSYTYPAYPKPYATINTKTYTEDIDFCFGRFLSPGFPLWVEKIKVCLHQAATYGCIKINVWDFGPATQTPINLVGLTGDDVSYNIPLTVSAENKLISNALDNTDLYMVESEQVTNLSPFSYTIAANSLLRFGVQYAESNCFGLKVFLVCWALECDMVA